MFRTKLKFACKEITKNCHLDGAVRKKINTKVIFLPSGINHLREKSGRKRSVEVSDYLIGLN